MASLELFYDVEPTRLVFAPAGPPHALEAADDSRMVVIYVRSPGRQAQPGSDRGGWALASRLFLVGGPTDNTLMIRDNVGGRRHRSGD